MPLLLVAACAGAPSTSHTPLPPAESERVAAPGPEHEALARHAGSFELTSRYWHTPDADPDVSQLRAERVAAQGNRVLLHSIESAPGSWPFAGNGMSGFDRASGEHWYVWADTTTTGVTVARGKLRADGTGILAGTTTNMVPGQQSPIRIAIHREDEREVHSYLVPESGRWRRVVELSYVRVNR